MNNECINDAIFAKIEKLIYENDSLIEDITTEGICATVIIVEYSIKTNDVCINRLII